MYKLFFSDDLIICSRDFFEDYINFLDSKFNIIRIFSCDNKLMFYLSDTDTFLPNESNELWSLVGIVTDPDYLLPYQEAMLNS